jgi:hypothetical protein
MDSLEHIKFHKNLIQEIRTAQVSEEGGSQEQLFTNMTMDLLGDSGMTENARAVYDEKTTRTGIQHKINGYSLSDNYETLDLFISVFNGTDDLTRIPKDEVDRAAKRATAFFKNAVYKDYVKDIEESSEVFDLAHTLGESQELKSGLVRVNIYILTDGFYAGATPVSTNISGYAVNYQIIDLVYLYNISEKSHIPIEIDFSADGFTVPCIAAPSENSEYQSYLAIISGAALASIYERYGSRLLEQNVRSFLQFTGKINNGIRKTIKNESHMFLAFNNGLAATAEEIILAESKSGGKCIASVKDLQIVNGGQTTASIYHTWKKDKADISGIFVQLKLSVVKNRENFSDIVSRIAEYANTQNKVSVADLSSNRPFHIDIEKLSRTLWAPSAPGKTLQTRWFYERARGQYKNARLKDGFTAKKQAAFDLNNPKNQVITKEDLAKYVNTFTELYDNSKLVIGPHYVVRGNQKNYVQFINYNLIANPDNIYYEDAVAKAILFREAEKKYGVKPNAIGDLRYITVPYSLAMVNKLTAGKLNYYKIWKAQGISAELLKFIYDLMIKMEDYIKANAPGSLYGEWAKKENCWEAVKLYDFQMDIKLIAGDIAGKSDIAQRKVITDSESEQLLVSEELERLKSVPPVIWYKIEEWGKVTEKLTMLQRNVAFDLAGRVKNNSAISEYERTSGIKILDSVIENEPEILFEIDEITSQSTSDKTALIAEEITLELIKRMVEWDKKNKKLKDHHYAYMRNILDNKIPLGDQAKRYIKLNLDFLKKVGFR